MSGSGTAPGRPSGGEAEEPNTRTGSVDLARAAFAQARADARRRGVVPGKPSREDRSRAVARRTELRSGARADDRDPQTLQATIGKLFSERGWEVQVAVFGVMGRWNEIVGDEVAAHCQPDTFVDGELLVRADSTAWATQVRLLAGTLVRRLNEDLGDGTVTWVRVLGPAAPTWRKGARRVPGRGPRDTYG